MEENKVFIFYKQGNSEETLYHFDLNNPFFKNLIYVYCWDKANFIYIGNREYMESEKKLIFLLEKDEHCDVVTKPTNENKIHAVNLATAEYEDSDKKIIDSESRYKEEETILTTKYTNYLLSASESILKLKEETGVTLVINKLRCGLLESSTDMG